MAFFSKPSTSHYLTTSSESENEIRNNKLVSNLSSQISNNSLKYFKKMKKTNFQSKAQLKNENSDSLYSLKLSKTKHNLSNSNNLLNYRKKKYFTNSKICSSSINLNKKFAFALNSSSDSDFSDINDLKFVSKNNEINTSFKSKDSRKGKIYSNLKKKRQSKCYSNLKNKEQRIHKFIDNNRNTKHFESSTSSNSLDFSSILINNRKENNEKLQFDDLLLSDCSFSDAFMGNDDFGDRNSQLYSTPKTASDNSFILIKSISPKILPINISLGITDEQLTQKPSNVIINIPNIISGNKEYEQVQTVYDIKVDGQECILNKDHSKIDESITHSNVHDLYGPESISNCFKSELICSNYNINFKKNTKRSKSKPSLKQTCTNTSDVLRIKKPSCDTKKTKKYHSTNATEDISDIGLEYDTCKDNYMVELPNGTIVPAFLATLKPKYVKKICACGITASEIPISWGESFHNILHQNIYKLHFKGNIPSNNIINFKQNDLFYKIVSLSMNENDENTKKSVKDIEDFVNLEYNISKTNIQSYNNLIFLAILPNFKVIGYLEVKPIQNANKLTDDGLISKITVPVKFGILKIWVLIKYRNKNVDVNLLETFCNKEKIQKKDLAFTLDGCQGIQFIQEFIGNTNILIYNERLTSPNQSVTNK